MSTQLVGLFWTDALANILDAAHFDSACVYGPLKGVTALLTVHASGEAGEAECMKIRAPLLTLQT